jgi:hypothetical protein
MSGRDAIRVTAIGVSVLALWYGVFNLTAGPHVSFGLAATVLVSITAIIYWPLRKWKYAWLIAAMLAGCISLGSLLLALAWHSLL